MSLLDDFYEEYTIMNRIVEDDPEGGWITGWTPGATIRMALDKPTQAQWLVAETQKVEFICNAIFPIGTPIKLNDYLRSVEDESKVFRIQKMPVNAPGPAGIQVRNAEVIQTRLPV